MVNINEMYLKINNIDERIQDKYNTFRGAVNTCNPLEATDIGEIAYRFDEVCELRRIKKDYMKELYNYYNELDGMVN